MKPILLIGLLAILPFTGPEQDGTVVVEVPVTIEGGRGLVGSLEAVDLVVEVDGRGYRSAVVSPRSGATILLLVDVTTSATCCSTPGLAVGHRYNGVLEGVRRGLVEQLRANERLRIGRVGSQGVTVAPSFSTDRQALADSIDPILRANVRIFAGQASYSREDSWGSPIWDGVMAATNILAPEPAPRALILVTDGLASANRFSVREAAEYAAAAGVVLYTVFTPYDATSTEGEDYVVPGAQGSLRHLAETTGGLSLAYWPFREAGWRTPIPPFGEVLDAIRTTHLLRVSLPPGLTGRHTLDVRSTSPDVRVRAPTVLFGHGNRTD